MARSPAFLIRGHGCSLSLNLIDRVHKGLDIQMRVHTFGERHGTGVSHDFLDHGLIHMRLCQHGDTGVSGTVGCLRVSQLFHQGCEIAVIIVSVIKVLLIRGVE